MFGNQQNNMNPNKDIPVDGSDAADISCMKFSPTSNHLLASAWDGKVRVWEINNQGQSNPSGEQAHAAPVLSCAWNPQGNQVATGVADKSVMLWDLGSNQMKQIGGHDAPVKEVHYFTAGNSQMVVSGSWDRTICYWDMRQEQAAKVVKLPERVWTMDLTGNLLTAILGNNEICVFDLNNPDRPVRDPFKSPLPKQPRMVTNFPDCNGFAIGGIEGRVAIHHVDPNSKKNFAFKCHRHEDNVFAVNCISFHPTGKFSTAGSDGEIVFWDKDIKQKLHSFKRMPAPITATDFNANGTIFAYAIGYDWSKGSSGAQQKLPTGILVHGVQESEMKPSK